MDAFYAAMEPRDDRALCGQLFLAAASWKGRRKVWQSPMPPKMIAPESSTWKR
jgi:hypothetical protein